MKLKQITFTKHALRRIQERSGVEKYAENMLRKAALVHETKDRQYYKNGRLRFVVREYQHEIVVITVLKDD